MEETRQLYESLSSHDKTVQELRTQLESGKFENEEPFTYAFWTKLHANHGSAAGYALGFLLMLLMKHEWMIEEFADMNEGHSVSKTLVLLFLIYGYSFITLGLELIQSMIMCTEIYYSKNVKEVKINLDHFVPQLEKWRSSKYFFSLLAVLWCMLNAVVGTLFWNWFWWNHICKSYHDRTCKNSWIGKRIRAYRNKVCYNGEILSVVCEKLVSYSPIMVLTVVLVFLANVMLPLINDYISMYYPSSQDFSSLSEIMDRLETSEEDEEDHKPNEDDSGAVGTIDAEIGFHFHPPKQIDNDNLGAFKEESYESRSSWKIIFLVLAFALVFLELLVVVNFDFITGEA